MAIRKGLLLRGCIFGVRPTCGPPSAITVLLCEVSQEAPGRSEEGSNSTSMEMGFLCAVRGEAAVGACGAPGGRPPAKKCAPGLHLANTQFFAASLPSRTRAGKRVSSTRGGNK